MRAPSPRSIILTLFSFVIVSFVIYRIHSYSKYLENIKTISQNAYFDRHLAHNQFLDAIDLIIKNGKLGDKSVTLIQTDFHSDLYRKNTFVDKNYIGVGNWVNVLLTKKITTGKYLIDSIYWVLPPQTKTDSLRQKYWDEHANISKEVILQNGPSDEIIYVDNSSGNITFSKPTSGEYHSVSFHKVTPNELPKFDNSNTILSIDYDYFIYADKQVISKPTPSAVRATLVNYTNTLTQKSIRPIFIGCSISSNYIYRDLQYLLDDFCNLLQENSLTKTDLLENYSQQDIEPPPGTFDD